MSNSNKTKIYSELVSGVENGYVTDFTQVKDVNMSDVTYSELKEMAGNNTLTPGHKYRITDPVNVTEGFSDGLETTHLPDGTFVVEAINGDTLKPYAVVIRYHDLYRLAKYGRLCTGTKYVIIDYCKCSHSESEIMSGVTIIKEMSGTYASIIVEALDSWTLSDKAKYVTEIQGESHYFDCTYKMGVSDRRMYPWCYGPPATIVSSKKISQDDNVFDICEVQTNTAEIISIYMLGTATSVPSLLEDNLFEFYTKGETFVKPTRRVGDYLYDCWGYHKGIVTWLKDDLENEAPFDFYLFAFVIRNEELLKLFGEITGYQYPLFMTGSGSNVQNTLKTEYRGAIHHNVFKSILPTIIQSGHNCYFDNTIGLLLSGYNIKAVNSKVRLERTNDFDVKDGAVKGIFYNVTIQGDGKRVWAYYNLSEGGTYIQIEDQLINIEDLNHNYALPIFYSDLYNMAVRGTLVPGRRYLILDGGTMPTPPDMLIRSTGTFLYGIVVTARDTRSFFEDVELVYNKELIQEQGYNFIDFSKFKAKYDFFGQTHSPFWQTTGLKPYFDEPLPYEIYVLNTLPDGTIIIRVTINTLNYTSRDATLMYFIYTDSRDLTQCSGWGFYDNTKGYVNGSYTASGCEALDAKGNPVYVREQRDLFIYLLSSYRGTIYEFEDDLGNRAEFDFYNNLLKNPGLINNTKPLDPNLLNLLISESYPYLSLFTDYDGNHVLLSPTYREYHKNNKIIIEQPTTLLIGKSFNNVLIEDCSVILSGSVVQTDIFDTYGYISSCEESKFISSTVNVTGIALAEINNSSITGDLAFVPCTLYNVISEYNSLSITNTHRYTLYGNNVNIGYTSIVIDGDGIYNINSDLTVTKLGGAKSQPVLELGNTAFNLDSIGDIPDGQRVTFKLVTAQNVSTSNLGYGFNFRVTCTKKVSVGSITLLPGQTATMRILFVGKSASYINGTQGTYFDAILEQNTFIPIDAGNDTNTKYSKVTTTSNGLMSKEDKIKLDTYPDIADVLINYDLNVKAINHRGYSLEAPENTIPAYILSKKMGFTYVEGDVSFTSDSVAVLLHDSTIDRTSDGSGNITSLTYQKVLQYDFGSWKSEEYAGVKIPTFKEWVICCKNLGLHPYIELKSAGGYTQAQINQVVSEVEECGMKGKVTYISFNNTYLGYVKNADGYARLGLLANPLNSTKISQAKALRTGTNEVFLDAKLSTVTSALISTLISDDLPLEVWTINTESEIISMSPYISGVTSDNLVAGKILYENSLTYTPPVSSYVATESVALDYDTLEFSDKSSKSLTASIQPSNATEPIMWQSSNDSVATVSQDGVVTPISDGECTVTATSDGISDSCAVNVAFTRFNVVKNIQGGLFENNDSTVVIGDSYTDTIIPQDGFSIKNAVVSITMGRVDITETSYSNGNITILDVDGDIEINVQCIQVPVYTITRNLIGCTSDSNIRSIGEGNPHTERITADDGYTLQDGTVLITMGGTDITSSYSDGTLTIAEVTGDIVISIEAVEFNEDAPIIDLDLVNVGTDGVITNLGSGGSNYNAIVQLPSSSDTFSASSTGLTLNRHAYANTPYGFAPSDVFSIVCRARIITKSAQNFQRIFRTDQDTPSIFYSKSALTLGGKLAGVSGNGNASHDEVAHFPSTLNTCYLGYQDETAFDESIVHTFIHTSDGTTIKWYVDGVLMASQNAEALKTSTLVGLGDNNPSQNYYATSIEVSEFKIYNRVIEIE